jgi:hypothetical protein
MQKIDRIDSTETINAFVVVNVPSLGIDLRRILIALRKEIPQRKLLFSSTSRADVFVPTLKEKFVLLPHKEFLIVKARKRIKLPMVMEGPLLDMKIIDIIVAWIEHLGINEETTYEP